MNARVKRVTAAQDAVNEDGLIVVEKLKKRPMFNDDGKFVGWIRRVIVDRPNKDLPRQPEAASERNEIAEEITSGRYQTYWPESGCRVGSHARGPTCPGLCHVGGCAARRELDISWFDGGLPVEARRARARSL